MELSRVKKLVKDLEIVLRLINKILREENKLLDAKEL